jgi:hypothetical protein
MLKKSSTIFAIFLASGFLALPANSVAGEKTHAGSDASLKREKSSSPALSIPSGACSEEDFQTWGGLFKRKVESRDYQGSNPAFPLFDTLVESTQNTWDGSEADAYRSFSLANPGKTETSYRYGLHSEIEKNFDVLFRHSAHCLSEDSPGFFKALQSALQSRVDSEHPEFDPGFFSKKWDLKKGQWAALPEGLSATQVETLNKLIRKLDSLSQLKQASPVVFKGLSQFLSKPNSREALEAFSQTLSQNPELAKPLFNEPALAERFSELINHTGAEAHLRQRTFLGGGEQHFTSDASPKRSAPGSTDEVAQKALSELSLARETFRKVLLDPASTGESASSSEFWNQYQQGVLADLKDKTPVEINRIRQGILDGLQDLDRAKPSSSFKSEIRKALVRESLLRASHAIEGQIVDPAAEKRSGDEVQQRGAYSTHLSELQDYLRGAGSERFSVADASVAAAQNQFGILTPISVANQIRKTDPFLLSLASSKNFFQTGHSTALFNLNDPAQAQALRKGLEEKLLSSGAISSLSDSDQSRVRSLLASASGDLSSDYKKNPSLWDRDYSETRKKLMRILEPRLGDKSPLGEKEKAVALAIEMIDSTGNHSVNPYSQWQNPRSANHYSLDSIMARFAEEKTLSKEMGNGPQETERSLKKTLHGSLSTSSTPQGLPSRARIAALFREGEEKAYEEELLGVYRDLLAGKTGAALSPSALESLKRLAFGNHSREELEEALTHLIPEWDSLKELKDSPGRALPESFPHSADYLGFIRAQEAAEKSALSLIANQLRDKIFAGEFETPEEVSKLTQMLRQLQDSPGALTWFKSNPPETWPESAQPFQSLFSMFGKQTDGLSSYGSQLNKFLDGVLVSQGKSPSLEARETLLGDLDLSTTPTKQVEAIGKLQARLGENHPFVEKSRKLFEEKWQADVGAEVKDVGDRFLRKEKKLSLTRPELLKKHGGQIKWDDSRNAYILSEDSKITRDLISDLKAHDPDFQMVYRDERSGVERFFAKGSDTLLGLLEGRDLELASLGVSVGSDEWIPINRATAIRWKYQDDGSHRLEYGDRKALEEELSQKLKESKALASSYDRATAAVGTFSHGSEGFFRGLGNNVTWGYVKGPSESQEFKDLEKSWSDFSGARSKLGVFGLLVADRASAKEHSQLLRNKGLNGLAQERAALQRYIDNAELTHDLTFTAATLALGGAGGLLAKGTSVARAPGLSGFLGYNSSNAWIPLSTQALSGIGKFSAAALQSGKMMKTGAALASPFIALEQGSHLLYGTKKSEIEKRVQAGKEWRDYPVEPQKSSGESQAEFEKRWQAWNAEKEWDRNGNGKPDFLEEDLKPYAYTGPNSTLSHLKGLTGLQRGMFTMGLVGAAAPALGFLPQVGIGSLLEGEYQYFGKAGKPGDLSQRLTQKDILFDSGLGMALMIPGVAGQDLLMRGMPSAWNRSFLSKYSPFANTREALGTAGFVGGSVASKMGMGAVTGHMPAFTGPDSSETYYSLLFEGYIGRHMAQAAAVAQAKKAVLAEIPPPSAGPRRIESGGTRTPSEASSSFEALAKRFGNETLEQALFSLPSSDIRGAKSPELLKQASEYLQGRAGALRTNAASDLKENPYASQSLDQVNQAVTTLTGELSGLRGWSLPRAEAQQKTAQLRKAQAAQRVLQQEAVFQAQASELLAANQYKVLDDSLNYQPNSSERAEAQRQAPELKDAMEAIWKAQTKVIPAAERAGNKVADWVESGGELRSAFLRADQLRSTSPVRNQRTTDVFLRAFQDARTNPEVQKQLGQLIVQNRPEAFDRVRPQDLDLSKPLGRDVVRLFSLRKLVGGESSKEQVERRVFEFESYVRSEGESRPGDSLQELWNRFNVSTPQRKGLAAP